MARAGLLIRFHHLDGRRRALVARTAIILFFASAAVAWLPFRRAIRFGSVEVQPARRARIEEILWAAEAAARRVPWRTMCIEKGLAVQYLLRKSGIDARLHYGARHDPVGGKLQAHVWVTVDGQPLIGGEEAGDFAEVATYP